MSRQDRRLRAKRTRMQGRFDALVALQDTLKKPRTYRQAIGEATTCMRSVSRHNYAMGKNEDAHVPDWMALPDTRISWRKASGGNTGIAQKQNASDAAKMRDNTRTGRPGRIIA